jgi:hypothetical protein
MELKRKSFSIAEKMEIISYYDIYSNVLTKTEIAKNLKIKRSSLYQIIEDRLVIENLFVENKFSSNLKKNRNSDYPLLDKCLTIWIENISNNPESGIVVDGNSLKSAAETFASLLGNKINISEGHLQRWRNKNHIRSHRISGESASADWISFENWKEKTIPQILSSYSPENIFNLDETGFNFIYFLYLPKRTLLENVTKQRVYD